MNLTYKEFICESSIPTFNGSNSVVSNVNSIISEITRTKNVLDKKSLSFWNFRRFLLTIGFPADWSRNSLRNSYFQSDNQDFYDMIVGNIPVSLKTIKLRSKIFISDYNKWISNIR